MTSGEGIPAEWCVSVYDANQHWVETMSFRSCHYWCEELSMLITNVGTPERCLCRTSSQLLHHLLRRIHLENSPKHRCDAGLHFIQAMKNILNVDIHQPSTLGKRNSFWRFSKGRVYQQTWISCTDKHTAVCKIVEDNLKSLLPGLNNTVLYSVSNV